MQSIQIIQKTLQLPIKHIENVLKLLDEGATIPFISRYRKEMTGNLDEVQIYNIQKEYQKVLEFEKRKAFIIQSIKDQGKWTSELEQKITQAETINVLEDIYLPYKVKKKTKAQLAIENGLQPLTNLIWKQTTISLEEEALKYINDTFSSTSKVLQGCQDIIAESMSNDLQIRDFCRTQFERFAIFMAKKKRGDREGQELYSDYFDFNQKLSKCPAHRILACFRAEDEGFLNVSIQIDPYLVIEKMERRFVKGFTESSQMIRDTCLKAYENILQPQMESEFRQVAKEKADQDSIAIFGENLKQLLLSSPLGAKRILGIDPGFRTGCKVVCISETGDLLVNHAIYPHPPQNQKYEAQELLFEWVHQYQIQAIAIGNGTAGRETEDWLKSIKWPFDAPQLFMVNESGASIYSASAEGREEFPNHDVTVRGAVSIARRLMDPLAELVKIDPKSIGVGQYQHDVNQVKLKEALDHVVVMAVNQVGVEVNTASKWLLKYISGIGPQIAQNIIEFRTKYGEIASREDLKKIPRLGDKAFELSAGFIRVAASKNPLDNTSVHPESYAVVEKMAKSVGANLEDFVKNKSLQEKIKPEDFISEKTGLQTIKDILKELAKPNRDPRATRESVVFDQKVRTIEDLTIGMELQGVVTNITNFGAFVNIGLKNDGLVHISQMSQQFISNPSQVVHLNQNITVWVKEIDQSRNRVQLTMVASNVL